MTEKNCVYRKNNRKLIIPREEVEIPNYEVVAERGKIVIWNEK